MQMRGPPPNGRQAKRSTALRPAKRTLSKRGGTGQKSGARGSAKTGRITEPPGRTPRPPRVGHAPRVRRRPAAGRHPAGARPPVIRLGVNVDHVATLRQARRGREPDPVAAAHECELGGADQLTIHLREDRRHIQDRDLRILRQTAQVPLNLELGLGEDVLGVALEVRPDVVTLVPERRQEVTTDQMIFNIYDQIAYLSNVMTLEPGDIIVTGTPDGVGAAMDPPSFLKVGGVMRVEMDDIGQTESRVVAEAG